MVALGVAQEFQRVFTGTTYHCDEDGGGSAEPSPAKIICVTGKPLFGHAGPPPWPSQVGGLNIGTLIIFNSISPNQNMIIPGG